ncbi:MAG: hypothetical protein FOGNACKC_05132 [Anaerolineae bacterium]|nr:hypothetical protein [Anaerolineae bacterium]
MALRRIKHVSAQFQRKSLTGGRSFGYLRLVFRGRPGRWQWLKSRRNLVPCLTAAGLSMLAGVAVLGLLCAAAGLMLWILTNPVAHPRNVARLPLPTLTPTVTPLATGLPAQSIIATATPPPVSSYQTVVARSAVAQVTPVATPPAATNSTLTALVGLNVRTGPGLDYPVTGKLAAGESATVVGQDATGAWWQIDYPAGSDGTGWVSADPQYSAVSNSDALAIAQAAAPPPPTSTPPAVATPLPAAVIKPEIPSAAGWSFTATRIDTIPARKLLLLYGEMVNNTGAAQQISLVTGTFYNSQGQLIAADKSTYGLWPTSIVPAGGHVPFALTVYDVQDTADFKLSVKAEAVDTAPRQDFEFVTVNEERVDGLYCLNGALKNPGSQLTDYLVIAAILYDEQGQVLRFFNVRETAVTEVIGDRALDFETCLESPPANVARHELLAWGS